MHRISSPSFMQHAIELMLHLDTKLLSIIAEYGQWTYAILFVTVFSETGLVITPFLPGDSLLFAAGSIAGTNTLNVWILASLLWLAATLGNITNYSIGRSLGPRIFRENAYILKRSYLEQTQRFYEKYGTKAIILSRFLPIFRTVAPFIAGVAMMPYATFLVYTIIGAFLWTMLFVWAGYLFGQIPVIRENFGLVILGIIAVSLLPGAFEIARQSLKKLQKR